MSIKNLRQRFQSRFSMQTRICMSFIAFTLIVAGLLWFFVIILLPGFYYTSKIEQTREIASDLLRNYENAGYAGYLDNVAVNNQTCISILDEFGRPVYERDVMSGGCLLHGKSSTLFYLIGEMHNSPGGIVLKSIYNETIQMDTLVLGTIISDGSKVHGYLFLNTALEPISSTVALLQKLLRVIIMLLLLIGTLIALYSSQRLSVPIVKLTHSAHRLAKGDFNTRFEGGGCREVDELARTLTYAEHELSRVDTMQRDLMANVSHDLRTPLTMLKAYAEMIRDLSGDNPEKRNAHLQIIIEETDRLTALVNDILDLSKFENGSLKLEQRSIDAAEWLGDIIGRYKGVSEKMGYHIHFTPDEPVQIFCDPARLERVVCNLINNAVNYTGEDKNVFVTQINTPTGVRIEVRDTGEGIEEDKICRIFDKYYRSENHKREVVGTGLGLSIVKAILKLHGFDFGVQSKIGEGSVFWFEARRPSGQPA